MQAKWEDLPDDRKDKLEFFSSHASKGLKITKSHTCGSASTMSSLAIIRASSLICWSFLFCLATLSCSTRAAPLGFFANISFAVCTWSCNLSIFKTNEILWFRVWKSTILHNWFQITFNHTHAIHTKFKLLIRNV